MTAFSKSEPECCDLEGSYDLDTGEEREIKVSYFRKKIFTIADALEKNRSMMAVKDGLLRLLPLVFIGSMALVVSEFPIQRYQDFIHTDGMHWYLHAFQLLNQACMSWYSLFLSISIADCYIKNEERYSGNFMELIIPVVSVVCFLILSGITNDNYDSSYMGTSGMFIAIFSSLFCCKFFLWISKRMRHTIKRWSHGFDARLLGIIFSIFPSAVVILASSFINVLLYETLHCSLQQLVSKYLVAFFLSLDFGKFLQAITFIFTVQLLWFFGIHGNNVLYQINDGYYGELLEKNIQAVAHGQPPQEIVHSTFLNLFTNFGGSGATLGLLLAILLFSRRRSYKSIAKAGFIPGIFNINEILIQINTKYKNRMFFLIFNLTNKILLMIMVFRISIYSERTSI